MRDIEEAKKQLRAVIELARANFPRSTDIKIETHGSDPHATLYVPVHLFDEIVNG